MSYPPPAQSQSQSSLGGGDSSVPHPFDVDQHQYPYSSEPPIANSGATNANISRKGSIGAQTHKSSLQVGSAPSDGIYAPPPYPLPPVPSTSSSIPMSSSSTGRARAHSRSQISQAGSTSLSLSLSASPSAAIISEQKIQPGAELVEIHDRKHHQIPDAPYPLYYESISTDLDHWDHVYFRNMKKSVSFVSFGAERTPRKCLDLGCGNGTWVLDAAREWPKCEFWGYDLVPIQPPEEFLGEVGERVHWTPGNFVKEKLPFPAEMFDFVHIRFVARGVPEDAWSGIFKEVHRVLTPDGVVELMEEDIIFPKITLPWNPLDDEEEAAQLTALSLGETTTTTADGETSGSQEVPAVSVVPSKPKEHPHRLLEYLHDRLYEQELIGRRPTSFLAFTFTAYFSSIQSPPAINFPLPNPPIEEKPPTRPVPPKFPSAPLSANDIKRPMDGLSTESFATRDRSKSLNNAMTSYDRSKQFGSDSDSGHGYGQGQGHGHGNGQGSSSSTNSTGRPHANTEPPPPKIPRRPYLNMSATMVSRSQSTSQSSSSRLPGHGRGSIAETLDTMFPLGELEDPNLSMHMHRSFQNVLAAREGMWRILKTLMDGDEEQGKILEGLGWDIVPGRDEEEDALRERFDQRLMRYTQQMNARCGLGQALCASLNWDPPFKDPPTRKELARMEYERESAEQHGANRPAFEESPASRSIRVFIGYKNGDEMMRI